MQGQLYLLKSLQRAVVFVCYAGRNEFSFDFFNVYVGACSIRVKADVQPSPWLRFYSLHTHWTEINVQLPVLWFLSEFVLPLFSTVCTFIWYGLFIIYVSQDHLGKLRYCFHSYHLYITKTLPWPRHKCFFSISLGFQSGRFSLVLPNSESLTFNMYSWSFAGHILQFTYCHFIWGKEAAKKPHMNGSFKHLSTQSKQALQRLPKVNCYISEPGKKHNQVQRNPNV